MAVELTDWPHDNQSQTSALARQQSANNIRHASFLRGVPTPKMLQGFGRLLKSPSGGSQYNMSDGEAEELYNMSHEVQLLDWFISYSWSDGRWRKYLCIQFVLNKRLGVVCFNLVAATWLAMTFMGVPLPKVSLEMYFGDERAVLTYGCIGPVSGVVSLLSVFSVHRISPASKFQNFFLDKCCIHQLDPIRKAEGISKLGGFLHKSRRMLVMWSPGYLTRLWCIYELACYSSLIGWPNIVIMPLFYPLALCLTIPLFTVVHFYVFILFGSGLVTFHAWATKTTFLFAAAIGIAGFLVGCVERKYILLCQQLSSFKFANTECYCCSVGHQLPNRDTPIPCDRLYVEENIRKWFAEVSAVDESEGMEAFERHVRENIGAKLAYRLQGQLAGILYFCFIGALSWIGIEAGFLTTLENGWLCPRSAFLKFFFGYGCILVLSFNATQLCMRRLIRAFGDCLAGRRQVVLDVVSAVSTFACYYSCHEPYMKFCWQHRKDELTLSGMAVVLGSLVLACLNVGCGA